MKITPLPPIDEVERKAHLNGLEKAQSSKEIKDERTILSYGYFSSLVGEEITQDRDQAYTNLIEGIEGMKRPCPKNVPSQEWTEEEKLNDILDDIIERVVKPLYGKE